MALEYKVMEQSLIPNTIMTEKNKEGILLAYDIAPEKGYILHDKELDEIVFDEEGRDTGIITLGYYPIARSCGANYDFDNTTVIAGYTAYGEREFFARPINEVPEFAEQQENREGE